MRKKICLIAWSLFLLVFASANAEQIKDGLGKSQLPDSSTYEGYFANGLFNGLRVLCPVENMPQLETPE